MKKHISYSEWKDWSICPFYHKLVHIDKLQGFEGNIYTAFGKALHETIEVDLPAVITADLRLNEPRYVKLPDIMKAKKKPLDKVSYDEIVNSNASDLTPSLTESPPQREKGIMVESVPELVNELKNKGLL